MPEPSAAARGSSQASAGGTSADRSGGRPVDPEAEALDRLGRAAFDRARQGDRAAYGQVVRVYHDRLYNAVYRLVRHSEDAADLVQDTFAKGFEKLGEFRGDSGPYSWLFRIAVNASMTHLRRGRRRREILKDAAADPTLSGMTGDGTGWRTGFSAGGRDPADATEQSEDQKAVLDALGRLDAEYRALLVMRDLEDFDYKQMAEILDLPLGTLKSRLFRARVALRELLQDHFNATRRRGH